MTGAESLPDDLAPDVLVVGAGVAGCAAALSAARAGADVLVATAAERPADATSYWAQGGVAVTTEDPQTFRADVLEAADGKADPDAVDVVVDDARDAVTDLLVETLDVPFDRADEDGATDGTGDGAPTDNPLDEFARCREGGHSTDRILHVDASTGKHVLPRFLDHLADHERVRLLTDTAALQLLADEGRVTGAVLERDGDLAAVPAEATVLATGGIGDCYATSTNPSGTTGDGIAMAALVGADVADMAYVQFHPTASPGGETAGSDAEVDPDGAPFLVSEAVRGAGAKLYNADGERFMVDRHPDAELAPRDVVARAVAAERDRTGAVTLDVSDVAFTDRFPDLAELCADRGIDPDRGIPVAPAQHFLCGGIAVDDRGRASLDRLFAVGECSRTGVHGANRLASTSLLEGLVWGRRAGETAATVAAEAAPDARDSDRSVPAPPANDPELPPGFETAKFRRLRTTMDAELGVERTPEGLRRAAASLRRLKGEVDAYARTRTSRELASLRHAVVCSVLIARAAAETPSAGCHRVIEEHGEESSIDGPAARPDGGHEC